MNVQLKSIVALSAILALRGIAFSEEIQGDSNVTGSLDVEGDTQGKVLTLGSGYIDWLNNDPNTPGFTITIGNFTEDVLVQENRSALLGAQWTWSAGSQGSAMVLDSYYGYNSLWVNGPVFSSGGVVSSGQAASFFGGKVGIGTSAPAGRLSIMDNVSGLQTGLNISPYHTPGVAAGTTMNAADAIGTVRSIALQTNGGYVGIGTTNPNAPLTLEGGIPGQIKKLAALRAPRAWTPVDNSGVMLSFETSNGSNAHDFGALVFRANPEVANGSAAVFEGFVGGGSQDRWTPRRFMQAADGGGGVDRVTFYTQDSARLTIAETGNVGIGNLAPQSKLDVAGQVKAEQYAIVGPHSGGSKQFLRSNENGSNEVYGLEIQNWKGAAYVGDGKRTQLSTYAGNPTASEGVVAILATVQGTYVDGKEFRVGSYSHGPADVVLYPGQNKTLIAKADGKVGIGTAAPQANLDVVGNARFSGRVRIEPQGDISMGSFTSEATP